MSNKNSCYSKLTHNHEAFILWPNLYFPNLRDVIFTPLVTIQVFSVLLSLFYFEIKCCFSVPPSSVCPFLSLLTCTWSHRLCVLVSLYSVFHRDASQCLPPTSPHVWPWYVSVFSSLSFQWFALCFCPFRCYFVFCPRDSFLVYVDLLIFVPLHLLNSHSFHRWLFLH